LERAEPLIPPRGRLESGKTDADHESA
jgi:hypothetical protein